MRSEQTTENDTEHQPVKVLVYPITPDNPYQSLLYDALVANNYVSVRTLRMPTTPPGFLFQIFIISAQLVASRIRGYRLIHVHWLYQLGFPGKPIWPWMSHAITTIQIWLFLFMTKLLGYKLVWTVHDMVPHHKLTLNDKRLTQTLVDRSDKLIALSTATIDEIHSHKITYDVKKLAIIPHGNYIGSYPDTVSKLDARQKLGISKSAFVYLFFGTILPYKNAGGMLQAFESIVRTYPEAVMIIAGKVAIPDLANQLQETKERLGDSLQLYLDFVPDTEVQNYFNAADIAVLPYLKITNSGAALLAVSFSKPIIAPRIGALKDLPEKTGIYYSPGSQARLEGSMIKAIKHKNDLPKMSSAARKYAQSLSWNTIAEQTYNLYKEASK